MLTKIEIAAAIEELQNARHTIQNCEKLAALYPVNDHMFREEIPAVQYSEQSGPKRDGAIDVYGDSEFLQLINGKDSTDMWLLMDEVMSTIEVLNPKLYDSIIRRLT